MRSLIQFDAGLFYSLGEGYGIVSENTGPGEFTLGQEYQLGGFMTMHDLMREGKHVGYYFYSGFKTRNSGGFIVSFMESKRGKATSGSLVIRSPEVMVYEFPSCGAMAISTKVNESMLSILMEQ